MRGRDDSRKLLTLAYCSDSFGGPIDAAHETLYLFDVSPGLIRFNGRFQ